MRILITNDDGYKAKGIQELVEILRPYGDLTIVAPNETQSGMSMAVSMGYRPIAVKKISELPGEQWWTLDGTPASCVKFGIDNIMTDAKPDLVVSGINHGSNAATATLYSGTMGACREGAVNGILSIGVSLDSFLADADFSAIKELLPGIIDKILAKRKDNFGLYYNINFPDLPASQIKGIKPATMGYVHWEDEYRDYKVFMHRAGREPKPADIEYLKNAEPGTSFYIMVGDLVVNPGNKESADQLLLTQGYVTITPESIDETDYAEYSRLCDII